MTPSDNDARPSKIVCVGKNYREHAAEMGGPVPDSPILFLKPPSSVIAAGDPIVAPSGVGEVHFEGEIAVRISRSARHLSEAEAWDYVEGVLPLNDVTAREIQRKDGQWSRAKSFDTFCPLGPVVPISLEELPSLSLTTRVNGEERQRAQASDMVFSLPFLLSFITRVMTLEPGDIVATGTPEGVGALEPGDEVEVEISSVGTLRNPVVGEGDIGS